MNAMALNTHSRARSNQGSSGVLNGSARGHPKPRGPAPLPRQRSVERDAPEPRVAVRLRSHSGFAEAAHSGSNLSGKPFRPYRHRRLQVKPFSKVRAIYAEGFLTHKWDG